MIEYIIKHFPTLENAVVGSLYIKARFSADAKHKEYWVTIAAYLGHLPDLMNVQLAGSAESALSPSLHHNNPSIT
jgi:hypothetical protein